MNDLSGDMIIDDLPTGPFLTFILTTLISWFFQLPGFLLTYLLHRTHAARFGSLAGLALTFIQFGFGTSMTGVDLPGWGDGAGGGLEVPTTGEDGIPTQTVTMDIPHPTDVPMPTGDSTAMYPDMSSQSYVGREWITFILMTMGKRFLLICNNSYIKTHPTKAGSFFSLRSSASSASSGSRSLCAWPQRARRARLRRRRTCSARWRYGGTSKTRLASGSRLMMGLLACVHHEEEEFS